MGQQSNRMMSPFLGAFLGTLLGEIVGPIIREGLGIK